VARRYHKKFAAAATITDQALTKVYSDAEKLFLNLKEQGPLNIKNKCPEAQWQIISYRLIPL
jgi:hypothetical protein